MMDGVKQKAVIDVNEPRVRALPMIHDKSSAELATGEINADASEKLEGYLSGA